MAIAERIHAVFNHAAVRAPFAAWRVPAEILVFALLIPRVQPGWFLAGLPISLVGALGQTWCFACIHKRKTLACRGPYALCRNPMYLARFALVFGALMFVGSPWLLVAFSVVYYFYVVNRVDREEIRLRALFGEEYERYCGAVNRFVPSLRGTAGNRLRFFSWDTLMENHGIFNAAFLATAYLVAGYFAIHSGAH